MEKQEKFYISGKTVGFMSLNTPASLTNYDYWNISKAVREKAIQQCLDNANWAVKHRKVMVPIYCSLEVSTYEEARYWFQKARNHFIIMKRYATMAEWFIFFVSFPVLLIKAVLYQIKNGSLVNFLHMIRGLFSSLRLKS